MKNSVDTFLYFVIFALVMDKNKIDTSLLYNEFNAFLKKHFPYKVQKISLDAGFSCPNRDGSVGWGGCTYCNNRTFNPAYCHTEKSIALQMEEGKAFLLINIQK